MTPAPQTAVQNGCHITTHQGPGASPDHAQGEIPNRSFNIAGFVEPALAEVARELGFAQVRSGPLVRSSYHAAD